MSQASCAAGGGTGDGRAETHSPARHRKLAVDQGQSGRILASGVIRRVISHHAPTRDCGTSVDGSYLVGRIRWVLTFFFSVFYLTPYAFLLTEGQGG